MRNTLRLVSFLWELCHEQSYQDRQACYLLLADGELLELNSNQEIVKRHQPPMPWLVEELPQVEVTEGGTITEVSGIIVDYSIALRLRQFTNVLIGHVRNADFEHHTTIS